MNKNRIAAKKFNNRITVVFFGEGITNVKINTKTQQKLQRVFAMDVAPKKESRTFKVGYRQGIVSENVTNLGESLIDTAIIK